VCPIVVRALALSALAVPCAAFAARPFNTDDARIVDPGGNQIEAYVKDQRGVRQTEYWLLPARNFGGGLDRFEFSIGGNYTQIQDGGDTNVVVAQAKTLLKPLETNGIGFAFSVGLARLNPGAEAVVTTPEGLFDVSGETVSNKVRYNPYLNAISSVSVLDDGAVFHFNAGATRENGEKSTIGNWGVGVEIGVTERVFGIAEAYGVSHEKPAYQAGVRYWAIPGRLQIDATYGFQHASPDDLRWISVGVRILW
jgi:hypothetical protein